MTRDFDVQAAAARLVADLMPISVLVDGDGAAAFAQALAEAGAAAETLSDGAEGFDLAILLAPAEQTPAAAAPAVARLAAVSDRLLFARQPLGATAIADFDSWFELFAEQGYQPVVEYDASFLGQGAFLVDRNATAAEAELAGFVERVSMGGALAASTQRVAALEAELGDAGDRAALKQELAQREAALLARQATLEAAIAQSTAWQVRAAHAESELATLRAQLTAWQQVGAWAAAWTADPSRNTLAALRAARGTRPRRGILSLLRRHRPKADAAERALLEDGALIRASSLFDAAWYVASQPELARSGGDPVWHYLLHGARHDPGPWFDSAAYRAAHPELTGCPLTHAIRSGAAAAMTRQQDN